MKLNLNGVFMRYIFALLTCNTFKNYCILSYGFSSAMSFELFWQVSFYKIAKKFARPSNSVVSKKTFRECSYLYTFNKKTLFVDFYLFFFCSSIVSFYGPLTVMCVTYFRIYKAAVAHTKSLRLGAKQLTTNGSEGHGGQEVVLRMHRGGGTSSASAAGTPNGHR